MNETTRQAVRPNAYAPRNALNADALKKAIETRSAARDDADEVRAWLLNHFWRHLVANFEPATPINSLDEARKHWGHSELPGWVEKRFSRSSSGNSAPLVRVDPMRADVLALEVKLVEFLRSRGGTALEGKLERINCPQAIALREREHAEIAARKEQGWRESDPRAVRVLLETENGSFVEFLPDTPHLRSEMAFESYAMRHCVGQFADRRALTGGYGENYAQDIEAGRMRLLSFRDFSGHPHITISAYVEENGALRVDQVKGKQNCPPVDRYAADVMTCLNALQTNGQTPHDCLAIGVAHTPAGWRRVEDVRDAGTQAWLVARNPELFVRLHDPAPLVEWMVAAHRREMLQSRPARSPGVNAALGNPVKLILAPEPRRSLTAPATRLSAARRRLLAPGAPMAMQHCPSGFFSVSPPLPSSEESTAFRRLVLHYFECRVDAVDEQARAHLEGKIKERWFCLDLHTPLPTASSDALMAFACVRSAFCVRLAMLMRWIDNDAGWRILELNNQRATECFDGWEAFGRAYMEGRRQWVSAFRADPLGTGFDQSSLTALLDPLEGEWGRTVWASATTGQSGATNGVVTPV